MRRVFSVLTMCALALSLGACETSPKTSQSKQELHNNVQLARQAFLEKDPTMRELFEDSHGYAIFPSIAKGGLGVGGAGGRGEVYERGRLVGYANLTQATIGAQAGGQSYRQVIFFENEAAFDRFANEQLTFSAEASAVAASSGAASQAEFRRGTLVFTMTKGGLMLEASIGGQRFQYEPTDFQPAEPNIGVYGTTPDGQTPTDEQREQRQEQLRQQQQREMEQEIDEEPMYN